MAEGNELTVGNIIKRNLFWWIVIAIEIYLIAFYEPGSGGRQRIHEYYIYDAYRASPRTVTWLDYADDLEYWFLDEDKAACSFSDAGGWFRKPDVYIHIANLDEREWKGLLEWCLPHEVGHYIDDQLDNVSESDEFIEAVELSIIMWQNIPTGTEVNWFHTGEKIFHFPGVGDNPLPEGTWGGYKELYAELHAVDYIEHIPPPLRPFYEEFLP